jgi:hypothetical protein
MAAAADTVKFRQEILLNPDRFNTVDLSEFALSWTAMLSLSVTEI